MKFIDSKYDFIEVVKTEKAEVESFMNSFEQNLKSWLYGKYGYFNYSILVENDTNRFVFGTDGKEITIPYPETKILNFINKMSELGIKFRLESPNKEVAEIKLVNRHQSNHHDSGYLFLGSEGKIDNRNNFEVTIFPESSSAPYFWNFLTYCDGKLTIKFSKITALKEELFTGISGLDFQSVEEATKYLRSLPKDAKLNFFKYDRHPSNPEDCFCDTIVNDENETELRFWTNKHPNHAVGSDTIWLIEMQDI